MHTTFIPWQKTYKVSKLSMNQAAWTDGILSPLALLRKDFSSDLMHQCNDGSVLNLRMYSSSNTYHISGADPGFLKRGA